MLKGSPWESIEVEYIHDNSNGLRRSGRIASDKPRVSFWEIEPRQPICPIPPAIPISKKEEGLQLIARIIKNSAYRLFAGE